jgi:dihydroflavonol-4-reductase
MARRMEARAEKTGKPPMLARAMFEYALRPNFYSNRKAVDELGATFRPIDETIRDAVAWFRARGMARERKRA